jgi:hypothetical protein
MFLSRIAAKLIRRRANKPVDPFILPLKEPLQVKRPPFVPRLRLARHPPEAALEPTPEAAPEAPEAAPPWPPAGQRLRLALRPPKAALGPTPEEAPEALEAAPPWPPPTGRRLRVAPRSQAAAEAERRRKELPVPLRLPLLHALLSFIFLALLPGHPLSIPTAFGLAAAVVVYIHLLAWRLGYYLYIE